METHTTQPELNLARKWRPKNFEHIVGQDIPVRMLKNGLFLKKFFPVYLFAGQRGCGKTSTARVFGAAVNCHQLENFQKDPALSIPCLTCDSCKAMIKGHHPDFIEIDAASHTGVDNVRQIIESSSYMPLLGQKKIYLIDEAHMLSKAAFNAFLKILEEPPMSVLFVLATTETAKIPQTVLSRCFQVVFTPIENNHLKDHLQVICKKEEITIDDTALDLLLAETEGSARDAINLLERVRFSCTNITEQTILSVLGKISNQELYTLFECALDQQAAQLLEHLHKLSFETMSPQLLWDMLLQLCRTLLWIKYGATASLAPWIKKNEQLNQLARKCSIERLHAIFQLFWTQEELFFKTNKKHAFLEMVLLQLCQQVNIVDLESIIKSMGSSSGKGSEGPALRSHQGEVGTGPSIKNTPKAFPLGQAPKTSFSQEQAPGGGCSGERATFINTPQASPEKSPAGNPTIESPTTTSNPYPQPWAQFLQKIADRTDSLVCSIFAQAKPVTNTQEQQGIFTIQLNSDSKFFRDMLEESKKTWLPLFIECFPEHKDIKFQAPAPSAAPVAQAPRYQMLPADKPTEPRQPAQAQPSRPPANPQFYKKSSFGDKPPLPNKNLNLEPINIDDKDKWPLANLIISHFPGKMKKMKEERAVPSAAHVDQDDKASGPSPEEELL